MTLAFNQLPMSMPWESNSTLVTDPCRRISRTMSSSPSCPLATVVLQSDCIHVLVTGRIDISIPFDEGETMLPFYNIIKSYLSS